MTQGRIDLCRLHEALTVVVSPQDLQRYAPVPQLWVRVHRLKHCGVRPPSEFPEDLIACEASLIELRRLQEQTLRANGVRSF